MIIIIIYITRLTFPIYVVEVDDEMDEDTLSVLLDPTLPLGISMCNTDTAPGTSTYSFDLPLC